MHRLGLGKTGTRGCVNLLTLIPLPYRILAMALLCTAIWANGWLRGAHHGEAKLAAFEVAVRAEGSAAQKLANDRIARERGRTDDTNAKYLVADAGRRAATERLRKSRPSGDIVPAAATGASDPDRACFDRAQLERALRSLDAGVSQLVDEGDQVALRLKLAVEWAKP